MTKKIKRVVIKVGTSTLTDESGRIDRAYLSSLTSQIAELRARGIGVVLVSSGAIRAGMERLDLAERPKTMSEKQAAAAVGQSLLMQRYSEQFAHHKVTVGQILLTRQDLSDRTRYLNARQTMLALLRHGVVPIVNENDTVAVDEIKVGDNDNLAALVASSIDADMLIILSDVPGLYDADPGKSPAAKVIPVVGEIDARIRSIAGGTHTTNGTGGMRTKIQAAEVSTRSGTTMVIADGRMENIIPDIAAGKPVGTTFVPKTDRLRSRKRWIAFGAAAHGGIVVNEGARKMLCERGKSLLPAGITGVVGTFEPGDLVRILDEEGNQFARGFVNYSAAEVQQIKGRKSIEIEEVLGRKECDEVVHRDNMALRT